MQNKMIVGIHEQRYIFNVTKHLLWSFRTKYNNGVLTANTAPENISDELQTAFNHTHIALIAATNIIHDEIYKLLYLHSDSSVCPLQRRYRIAVTKARLKRDMYNIKCYIEEEYLPSELARIVLCAREKTFYRILDYEPPENYLEITMALCKDVKQVLALCVKDWLQTRTNTLTGKYWLNEKQLQMISENTW